MLVVTVCTANLCRSPLAERLLARGFAERGADVVVRSTGVAAETGWAVPAAWLEVAAELAIDLRDHRSSAPEDVLDEADLILTMTAEQLRSVVVRWPRLTGRATTLGEAAVHGLPGPRTGLEVLATSGVHDISDPIGRTRRAQREIARAIDEHCGVVVGEWA